MLKRFIVKKTERAVLLRNGDFQRILNPGCHYVLDPLGELSIAVWHTDTPTGEAGLADELSHRGLRGTANADVAEIMVLA